VKVLFDQNMPRPLAALLIKHAVSRSAELGWSALRNGELLRTAEDHGFEVFVTADQNLSYQQNLTGRKLAIVVLPSGQWPKVQMRLPEIIAAVDQALPGSFLQLKPDSEKRSRKSASRSDAR
jgi:hypothetical protein